MDECHPNIEEFKWSYLYFIYLGWRYLGTLSKQKRTWKWIEALVSIDKAR
jgi:arginine exporter protein ArgO